MKFYLAGPVITDDRKVRKQMNDLESILNYMQVPGEEYIEVYRPGKHKVPNAWGIDITTWGQCVFTMDVSAIDECDWMVLADYGRQATAGTSWEAGYAFAQGVKILVIQMPGVEESSLMTQGCAANVCKYEKFINTPKDEIYNKFFYERGRRLQEIVLN